MIKIIGMSDALDAQTGFGRVSRELFTRLPKDKFDCAFLAGGWVGSRNYPGIQTYVGYDRYCQSAFPKVAFDFAGKDQFILWTLFDPWQVGWISHPKDNEYSTSLSLSYITQHREQFVWVGHWPIDGYGPRDGPPLFFEDYINAMDYPVAMSEFGQSLMQQVTEKPIDLIKHGVDTKRFFPVSSDAAKATATEAYRKVLAANFAQNKDWTPEQVQEAVEKFYMRLDDRFVVLVVMANRQRKYWIEVLKAFKAFHELVPDSVLIGVCADRIGTNDGAWPLFDYVNMLGLRLDRYKENPNVWLMDTVGGSIDEEDAGLRLLYGCADVTVLLSGGEGFGLPQLEAHACGKPCFVGNYSASVELAVDHRETLTPMGFNYIGMSAVKRPTYAPSTLKEKLVYAYKNPNWRLDVGRAGVEQAKRLSWDNQLLKWVSLFEKAAGGTIEEEKANGEMAVSTDPIVGARTEAALPART